MRGLRYCFAAAAFALTICNASLALPPKGNDEADIKTLEQSLMAAAKAKDLAKVMSFYAPGEKLFVFDVVPPRQYAGFDAYKKDWEDLFAH